MKASTFVASRPRTNPTPEPIANSLNARPSAACSTSLRMALGATPGNVQVLVFRQGFFNAAIGLAIGLVLTLVLMRILRGMLVGVEVGKPSPPWVPPVLVAAPPAAPCSFP